MGRVGQAASVLAAILALLAAYLFPFRTAGDNDEQAQRPSERAIQLDDRPYELRLKLADLTRREPPPEFASDEMRVRDALNALPQTASPIEVATVKSELAALVLESGFGSRPPDADAIKEGRELAEFVWSVLGEKTSVEGLRLRTLLMLAEGKPEEAISFASDLQQLIDGRHWKEQLTEADKKSPSKYEQKGEALTDDAEVVWEAYHFLAQTFLAATCEKACAARKTEMLSKYAVEGAVFKDDPSKTASNHRAGAMWRIMEAGRVYERAYQSAPTANASVLKLDLGENATHNALDCHFATGRLRNLNAFQVSTTAKLFSLGACEMYVGVKLDGKVCLAEDENPYEKKRKAEKKKTKKAMKKFARRAVDEAPVNA